MPNRLYDAFDSIKASEKLKVSVKQAVKREAAKKRSPFLQSGKVLAACVALCFLLGAGGLYGVNVYPVSYVSIDINPSMELSLNYRNKVIRAAGCNEDGDRILDAVSVKGLDFEDAVEAIVGCDEMAAYWGENAELTYTIAARSSDREEKISEAIQNCSSHHGYNATCYHAGMDAVSKAHGIGVSFGKYAAYLQLIEYDDTVTVEDCRDMSIPEIHELICEHEGRGKTNRHGGGHGHHKE